MKNDFDYRLSNSFICVLFGICFMMTSCAEDIWLNEGKVSFSDIINFGIDLPEGWNEPNRTKSNYQNNSYITKSVCFDETINGDTILLYAIVEDIPNCFRVSDDSIKGKSRLITRKGVEISPSYDFGVYAYVMSKDDDNIPVYSGTNKGISPFMVNTLVDVSNNFSYIPVMYWPGPEYWLKFFGYSPHINNLSDLWELEPEKVVERFSLSTTGNIPFITYSVPDDVNKQLDITTYNSIVLSGDDKRKVNFSMQHIMSAVRIMVGDIPEGNIEEVHFSNLKYGGSRNINENRWVSIGSEKAIFAQRFENDENGINPDRTIGNTFYLMPQELGDDVDFYMRINIDGRTYELKKDICSIIEEWEEGKQYTLVVTTPREVCVSVDDVLDYETKVKSGLVIKNTGLSSVYVRANILGSWVIQDKNDTTQWIVVAPWIHEENNPIDNDGVFDWGTEGNTEPQKYVINSRNWQKGEDGFYYYMKPVEPNKSIPPDSTLFNSYRLMVMAPPVAGGVLNLTIAVQAFHPLFVDKVWPVDILNNLTITKE